MKKRHFTQLLGSTLTISSLLVVASTQVHAEETEVAESFAVEVIEEPSAAVATENKAPATTESKSVKEELTEQGIAGRVVNEGLHHKQDDYQSIVDEEAQYDETNVGFQGDQLNGEIALVTGEEGFEEVTATASDFYAGEEKIASENIKVNFLKETSAHIGRGGNHGTIPKYPKENIPDIISKQETVSIDSESVQPVWLEINVPKDAKAGTYQGTIDFTVSGKAKPIKVPYSFEVLPLELPVDNRFTVELWQYPYTTARYYGISEDELFGEKHTEILREHLREYKRAGGDAITTTVTHDPWNHQTYDKYPGMVKWTKHEDGTFSFDFTQFDQYVTIAEEEGVAEKIKAFSMLPWNNQVRYYDEAAGKNVTKKWTSGTSAWEDAWGQFLEAFIAHLDEKGWFDKTYIALDERPINELGAVIDLVSMYPNKEGKIIKISAAINYGATDRDILNELDDVSISMDELADKEDVRDFIAERQAAGKPTTMYSMVGQYPNSFTRSNPIEAAWVLLYARSLGFDGYMRWAYDAWVKDPLTTVDHWYWESGDPFFIYPTDVEGDYSPNTSPRYEWLKEAYRLIAKIDFLESNYPKAKEVFQEIFDSWEKLEGKTNQYNAMEAASPEQAKAVEEDVRQLIETVNQLAREYAESLGTDDTEDTEIPAEPEAPVFDATWVDHIENPDVESEWADTDVEATLDEEDTATTDDAVKPSTDALAEHHATDANQAQTPEASAKPELPQTGFAAAGLGLGLLMTAGGALFTKKKK
ncbi:glycoside hydrolase domain-containing protein [Aerococcus vaginalis]